MAELLPHPPRLLLVEDNPDDLVFVQEILESLDELPTQLASAETLNQGLEHLAEGETDLVLLDLSLPDSFGLSTLERVIEHAPDVPVLIMTGHDEVETGLEAVRKGAQDYLVKGKLTDDILARTIRHALQRHQSKQELLERENNIRLLTAQLPAVLWTTDRDLVITSSMGAGLTRLNLLPGQVVGMTISEYFEVGDESAEPLQAHLNALKGRSVSFETKVRGRTQQVHVESWKPGGGRVAGVIGVAMDVTERRRIEEEMLIARHIQEALLPSFPPKIAGWDIAGYAKSADACSGDFYDFIPLQGGRWAAVVGDVSGHGFGPAILAASAHSYLRALARTEENVASVLEITNKLLIDDSPPEQYLTMFLLGIDPEKRTLEFAGCGHPTAFLFDREGNLRERLKSKSSPLGWFADSEFKLSEPISLNPGDYVYMQTDGILEAMSPEKEFFAEDRVLACLSENRDKPAGDILKILLDSVREFLGDGKQRDDMTAVILKLDALN